MGCDTGRGRTAVARRAVVPLSLKVAPVCDILAIPPREASGKVADGQELAMGKRAFRDGHGFVQAQV